MSDPNNSLPAIDPHDQFFGVARGQHVQEWLLP